MEYVEGKVGIVFSPEKVRLVRIPSVAALQKTRRHNDVELVGSQKCMCHRQTSSA